MGSGARQPRRYEIDPARLDLACEFRARPLGPHSTELQAVLLRMRSLPLRGKHCLIVAEPYKRWLLAQMTGQPLRPEPVPGRVFSSMEEAEWAIFKLRWLEITGHDLEKELGEPPPVKHPAVARPDSSRTILGYVSDISVAAGETIDFKVSCHGVSEYRADIVRLRAPMIGPDGAGFREDLVESAAAGCYPGRAQELHLGSFVRMPETLALPDAFTLQVLTWPTKNRVDTALIGNWSISSETGIALCLNAKQSLVVRLGDGHRSAEIATGIVLEERQWARLAVSFDCRTGTLRVVRDPLVSHGFSGAKRAEYSTTPSIKPVLGDAPLLVSAWHDEASVGGHFNGKLEAPCLFAEALDEKGLRALPSSADDLAHRQDLVALWDFSRDTPSRRAVDRGPAGHHGTVVNQPTRAVTGHLWDGSTQDWRSRPSHYGAIHFHDDDIDDAGWETDFRLTVPPEMKSGVYAARLRNGKTETYLPFFVRPSAKRARIAFLAPTATYTVYANNRERLFGATTELVRGRPLEIDAGDGLLLDYPLGLSTYCRHSDRSGVCYGTRLRPTMNMDPKGRVWNFCEDLYIIDWLERCGHPYDVITDDDLHREGLALLEPYSAIVTGTHPEYASLEMIDAVESYLKQGGRMLYMGGNGFYWRIAFRPDNSGVIEVRRTGDGTRSWDAEPGEFYMSFTGERGGLWRRQGRPPNMLVGVGFAGQGFDRSTYYRRQPGSYDDRAAFVFEGIFDDVIGNFGTAGGGAAGEEIDCFDVSQGSPPHALVLASSEGHSSIYQPATDNIFMTHGALSAPYNPALRADMVFFECPGGGAVFSTGSIAYAGSLAHNDYDNNVARLTGNVLRRFLDPTPFKMP